MTGWLIALGVSVAGGLIAFLIVKVKLARALTRIEKLTATNKSLGELIKQREDALKELEKDATKEKTVIASLKGELKEMENELATCREPGVVRDRLNRLLSSL